MSRVVYNFRHIKEHLAGSAKFDLDNASPEELEFHFFKRVLLLFGKVKSLLVVQDRNKG